ncbi:MAG TPA: 1-acyl-sn-glycerol-3-phosphate acyltransferase, partial [Pyrinomonadaceae bacterium]|nr:1-acyl-sn-glycerol-3-phosphate acyltransferase [Pyrinomonadaceae bacterium]
LGFTILEGYGLTEASPVLTVTRPENRMLTGSVGRPLPGVEVKISDPDSSGVGEVIARGPNVMLGYYANESATRDALVERWLYTGDLGKLDDEGNLFLVGRSKEIIVDTNGKNVYPDELEELYSNSPRIKELSIVGLPDGIGEKVACIVVADDEYDITLSRAELRRRVEEHFREVSASLPYYKRVKVLQFTEDELPRTATRKVKRGEVITILQGLEAGSKLDVVIQNDGAADQESRWLIGIVANVSNRPPSEISLNSRLADLGFDSLMFVELASAIENAGGSITAPERLNEAQDLRELAGVVSRRPGASAGRDEFSGRSDSRGTEDDEIHVPSFVGRAGTKAGDVLQRLFYDRFLATHYEGQGNIPPHTNFIVAANHSSHLDMGLTKMALGEAGKDMVVLAAADYFFDTKYKRAVMENFTNLVPMERTGSLRQSLRHAMSFLNRGYNALIFPEGTRSVTGELADFKPVIGYLALHTRVGILPVYLHGTYDAMPKGSNVIKNRKVGARIGRYLEIADLEEMTKGLPRAEAYRLISARVRHEVENLRDGARRPFDAKELRKRWKAERRSQVQTKVMSDEL